MKNKTKGQIVQWAAVGLDVGAPLVATVTQFPVWVERSAGSTVSGMFVVFALLSAIPLLKKGGEIFKSPSATLLFGIAAALLLSLRTIIDEMIIICAVGFVSNLVGAGIHSYGVALAGKEDK
jgi:hypothetical protein